MSDGKSWKFYEQLPEVFYDTLAYILPASLFFLALDHLFRFDQLLNGFSNFERESIVAEVINGFIFLGILYLVGQFATSLSFFAVAIPIGRIRARLLSDHSETNFHILGRWIAVRAKGDTGITSEISKRLARWVMSRNVAFLSLILSAICIIVCDRRVLIVSAGCFVVAITDFWIRTSWLQTSFDVVLEQISKEKSKPVATNVQKRADPI